MKKFLLWTALACILGSILGAALGQYAQALTLVFAFVAFGIAGAGWGVDLPENIAPLWYYEQQAAIRARGWPTGPGCDPGPR